MKKLAVIVALGASLALGAQKSNGGAPAQTRAISTEDKLAIRSAQLAVSQADDEIQRANAALQRAQEQLRRQVLEVEQRNGCVVRNDLTCAVLQQRHAQAPQVKRPSASSMMHGTPGTPKTPK